MNRTEFVIVTAIILLIAFALGWFAYWLLHRFSRFAGSELGEVDRLAQSLHEAEEMRDQAILFLEQREAEMGSQLAQTEAELRATMEGLRDARHLVDDLRARLEAAEAR